MHTIVGGTYIYNIETLYDTMMPSQKKHVLKVKSIKTFVERQEI